jgi:hypothetical protein
MSDGFFTRWSKRKLEAKEGKAPEAQPLANAEVAKLAAGSADQVHPAASLVAPESAAEPVAPPPTLEDVEALTTESDFTRFAARNVAPEVKNAAMKKLFADPRFNVMDGLDVYIDDYSQPDPMPMSMLRQLASAKFLDLFGEKEEREAKHGTSSGARDVADDSAEKIVAQSDLLSQAAPEPVSAAPEHADSDLRLQQDHAASGEDPGRGAR